MHRSLVVAIAGATLLAASLTPRPASAQEKATGGFVTGTQTVLNEIELADGRSIRRVKVEVGVTADDHSSRWHLGSQDCFATYVFAADDSLVVGRGVCDFLSPDGDVWWLAFEVSGTDPLRWTGLGGTGKFADVDHSGTTVTLAEWGDGKFIGRWDGTMTKK